jgi:hypothetical protein
VLNRDDLVTGCTWPRTLSPRMPKSERRACLPHDEPKSSPQTRSLKNCWEDELVNTPHSDASADSSITHFITFRLLKHSPYMLELALKNLRDRIEFIDAWHSGLVSLPSNVGKGMSLTVEKLRSQFSCSLVRLHLRLTAFERRCDHQRLPQVQLYSHFTPC